MATLADVAKRAAVSKGTVSRVLNNSMNMPISAPTIERIKRAAEELAYRPNALARALATGKTQVIGLYYGNMTDPHFARMLEAVEAKARSLGYHLVVSSDQESFQGEGRLDGLLFVGVPDNVTMTSGKMPVLFVTPLTVGPRRNCITWSDADGAYQAVQHLIELGHRRIAGIWGDYTDATPPQPRVAGFRKALHDGGATGVETYGELCADQIENGRLLVHRLRAQEEKFTAIFTRNDWLAIGALQALREANIGVPQEVSVVGFNDTALARCATPLLTSVRTPFAEAGVMALQKLVQAIRCGERDFPGVELPVTLIKRDSCAPPQRVL